MEINGVKMIPSGLVTCLVNDLEVRIIEMSIEAFIIRTAYQFDQINQIQINYFQFQQSEYREVKLVDYHVVEQSVKEFYFIYTIQCSQQDYQKNTMNLLKDYWEYIHLKLEDDGECAETKVGYPSELDDQFAVSYQEQKKMWFQNLPVQGYEKINEMTFEYAILIDRHKRYQQYLQLGIHNYVLQLWKENYLEEHPLARQNVRRVYIGNQFCHNLFPKQEELYAMMEQARKEDLRITIVTTYLREDQVSNMEGQINQLYDWCRQREVQIEIVVNDFGTLQILNGKQEYLIPVLGILMNKHRKDPRYVYKSGYQRYERQIADNNLSSKEYRDYLSQYWKVERFEYESCGYRNHAPEGQHSLHLPFYQTNTSQYCTLYAKYVTKDRGHQKYVKQCPYYCEKYAFLYPSHLKMIGHYNSIFALDDTLLRDGEELEYCLRHGINRIVIDFI